MTASQRSALVGGLVLIVLGVVFLFSQLVPNMWSWIDTFSWPWFVIGLAAVLLLIGVLTNTPGMAVPACILGGIGLLLSWQNRTGNWESWAYAWTLIPGFVGIGTVVMGLWEGKWPAVRGGLWLILISAIMFAVLGALFGGLFGGDPGFIGKWWPVALILLGVLSLIDYVARYRQPENGRR